MRRLNPSAPMPCPPPPSWLLVSRPAVRRAAGAQKRAGPPPGHLRAVVVLHRADLRVVGVAQLVAHPMKAPRFLDGLLEAPLHVGRHQNLGRPFSAVAQPQVPQQHVVVRGHKVPQLERQPAVGALEDGVAHAHAAAPVRELGPHGLVRRRPEGAALLPDVNVRPRAIDRHGPRLAVAGQAAQGGLLEPRQAAPGRAEDREQPAVAQVVDPRHWRERVRDDEFPRRVVEVPVLLVACPPSHNGSSSALVRRGRPYRAASGSSTQRARATLAQRNRHDAGSCALPTAERAWPVTGRRRPLARGPVRIAEADRDGSGIEGFWIAPRRRGNPRTTCQNTVGAVGLTGACTSEAPGRPAPA